MDLKKIGLLILITGGMLSVIFRELADAGGLYIYETGNPTDTGHAGAGMAGRASDAGTMLTKPAGMTRFDKSIYLASATPLYVHAPFNPDNTTTVEGIDGDTDEFFASGSFAYIGPVTDRLRLGVSFQNLFGLALNWGNNWVGRYEGTKPALIAPHQGAVHLLGANKLKERIGSS